VGGVRAGEGASPRPAERPRQADGEEEKSGRKRETLAGEARAGMMMLG
jgi:hypothetical protein